jgi:tetratricopeptide (TPR) repeat protein
MMMLKANIRIMLMLVALSFLLASCAITSEQKTNTTKEENVVVDSDVQRLFNKAVVLLKQKDYDNAITLLNTVVAREHRLTAPYIDLGMAYRQKGDNKNAEVNLMKALDIDLANPVANNELGLLYRSQGRFKDAKKAYTNALTQHPDYLPVIRNLGILCDIYLNDLDCALDQYEKYQKLKPGDKDVKNWIADLKGRMRK